MKRTIAMIAALLLAALLNGCGAQNKPANLLAGKWDAQVLSLEFQAIEFIPDGKNANTGAVNLSLLSNLIKGTYELLPAKEKGAKDTLNITYALGSFSTTRSYFITLTADSLTMVGENSPLTLNYTKSAAVATTNAVGTTG
ncbi:MAG: hypothetical protein LBG83_01995 [Oscillospiraceae bacterium]|jgi:hypothetical protein|nr:hypothetical protein [Oscillospiraceae bacterium]